MMDITRRATLAGLGGSALAGTAAAQEAWPSKPVRVLVGFTPGGGSDTVARILAARLTDTLGQNFVVENRPGAGGQIASELVSKAKPDGSTILVVSSSFAISPALRRHLPFDTIKSFTPVAWATSAPFIVVVHPSVQADSLPALIALAKKEPGTLSAASTAPGSTVDMTLRLFKSMAGVDIVAVAYQGPDGIPDLVAGRIQMTITGLVETSAQTKAGQLRALAVTTAQRSSLAPDLPTVAESGVPGFSVTAWYGVLVPAGTPDAIVTKLNASINAILAEPETKARFMASGMEPHGGTPAEFAHQIESEIAQWTKVSDAAHLRVD